MKIYLANAKHVTFKRLAILVVTLGIFGAMPSLLSARAANTNSITIVNNSSWEIRSVYLSPPDNDDWGSNQLGNAVIGNGESFTLNNVSCDATGIKVITEDQDGCFLSNVISCGDNATWTITNDATPDCGN